MVNREPPIPHFFLHSREIFRGFLGLVAIFLLSARKPLEAVLIENGLNISVNCEGKQHS